MQFLLHFVGTVLPHAPPHVRRYIPVGLLDRLPQQMHWRPPAFCGRNDLETLMASESAADWVKVRKDEP